MVKKGKIANKRKGETPYMTRLATKTIEKPALKETPSRYSTRNNTTKSKLKICPPATPEIKPLKIESIKKMERSIPVRTVLQSSGLEKKDPEIETTTPNKNESTLLQATNKTMKEKIKKEKKTTPLQTRTKYSARDSFPIDDENKHYFPCPVPYCVQIYKLRSARCYHMRADHPYYQYKAGDGWEKMKVSKDELEKIEANAMPQVTVPTSRSTSPASPNESPSPPAVVPTSEIDSQAESIKAQRRNEELAFSAFLKLEHQRLSKNLSLTNVEKDKKIVAKWMAMKPIHRLKYLDKHTEEEEKARIRKTLDENFSNRIKIYLGSNPRVEILDPSSCNILKEEVKQPISEPVYNSPRNFIETCVVPETPTIFPLRRVLEPIGIRSNLQVPYINELNKIYPYFDNRKMNIERGKVTVTKGTGTSESISSLFSSKQSSAPQFIVPSTAKEALDLYYLALTEPAFPLPGQEEPMTQHNANYYYDAYLRLARL